MTTSTGALRIKRDLLLLKELVNSAYINGTPSGILTYTDCYAGGN